MPFAVGPLGIEQARAVEADDEDRPAVRIAHGPQRRERLALRVCRILFAARDALGLARGEGVGGFHELADIAALGLDQRVAEGEDGIAGAAQHDHPGDRDEDEESPPDRQGHEGAVGRHDEWGQSPTTHR
ncbi:MAG: hypothetical protein M5U33_08115 [Pseudorhodoplanes sp.]|nr:hypothetical protein [Pseudorhodoplanes sp.]